MGTKYFVESIRRRYFNVKKLIRVLVINKAYIRINVRIVYTVPKPSICSMVVYHRVINGLGRHMESPAIITSINSGYNINVAVLNEDFNCVQFESYVPHKNHFTGTEGDYWDWPERS